ncbi:hypothetical protein HHK36_015831 [Tetracentron sinense]|uniref:Uncharacterized protein n=1 Tax=Tetracentron sinense TaxID=13715 RepID=A0A834Z2Y3_TETSI|nr:hypothetical protein HHK36_015831 [Tetracentron sinense]
MEEDDQKELQLLPTHFSSHPSGWKSESSRRSRSMANDSFDGPSLDLQLSISLRQCRPPSDCVLERPLCEYGDTKTKLSCVEALKWQAAEQIRLAAVEKAYADQVRELTKQEMELAQSEFARARHMWERARQEVEKAEIMKEGATRQVDSKCKEITCQACRQRFRP